MVSDFVSLDELTVLFKLPVSVLPHARSAAISENGKEHDDSRVWRNGALVKSSAL